MRCGALSWIVIMFAVALPARAAPVTMRGRLLFLRCASCHDISSGPSAKIGPNLRDVYGRPSGSLAGYHYSAAMQRAHLVWDTTTLNRWLTDPNALVPGTAMAFMGLPDARDRQAIIAYLRHPSP